MSEGYFDDMLTEIEETARYLEASEAKDLQKWPDAMQVTEVRGKGTPYFTYEEEVAYLKQYITKRVEWLNTQWGPEDPYLNRLYNNTLMGEMKGDQLNNTVGYYQDGCLQWDYESGESPNAPLGYVYGFESQNLEPGDYYYELTYRVENCVQTDYFMMECMDSMGVYAKTPATHLSYAVSSKDGNGFATVRLPFRVDGTDTESTTYQFRMRAYNAATVQVKEVRLMKAGEKRDKIFDIGDVNTDDAIDSVDALSVLQSSVGLLELSPMQRELANVDRKDGIDSIDAMMILQYNVGIITEF